MLHHIHSLTFGQNVATVTNEGSFDSLRDRIAVQGECAILLVLHSQQTTYSYAHTRLYIENRAKHIPATGRTK